MGRLILGDCFDIMKTMDSESVDLVYLDPPFFSNRNYEMIWGDENELRSFTDRWEGGIEHYITWLKERVAEMHRLLKPTGSIFLHCDWHADAYIRVHILDKIFGKSNFLNHITWKRTSTHNDSKQGAKHYGRITDTIFFYAKDIKQFTFHPQYESYTSDYIDSTYNKTEADGRRFKASDLSAAKPGGDTSYEWKGNKPPKGRYWAYSKENMEQFEKEGKIFYSSNGKPYLKHYLDEMPGASADCLWNNCTFKNKSERLGYPTQKPLGLLERIIKCASNEDDIVFDPFVGGGTTPYAAQQIQRNWIACDISPVAVSVTQGRLEHKGTFFYEPIFIETHVYNVADLRNREPMEFQHWIIERFDGQPNQTVRGDLGIDGMKDNKPIQVKRSDNVGRNVIDNFKSAIQRYDNSCKEGYLIAFSFGKGAKEEVARLQNTDGITIHLVEVKDIVPLTNPPQFTVDYDWENTIGGSKKITFTVKSDDDIVSVQFDWHYEEHFRPDYTVSVKPNEPTAAEHIYETGFHPFAIRVTNTEGVQSTISNKISVNGGVNIK